MGNNMLFNLQRLALSVVVALLLAGLIPAVSAQDPDSERGRISRNGHFRIIVESLVQPIMINKIHTWELKLESADGLPVSGAEITLLGGMPEHNHGLATKPRVTRSGDDGNYLVEGIRFHMRGYWELKFTVKTASEQDTVLFPLEL